MLKFIKDKHHLLLFYSHYSTPGHWDRQLTGTRNICRQLDVTRHLCKWSLTTPHFLRCQTAPTYRLWQAWVLSICLHLTTINEQQTPLGASRADRNRMFSLWHSERSRYIEECSTVERGWRSRQSNEDRFIPHKKKTLAKVAAAHLAANKPNEFRRHAKSLLRRPGPVRSLLPPQWGDDEMIADVMGNKVGWRHLCISLIPRAMLGKTTQPLLWINK